MGVGEWHQTATKHASYLPWLACVADVRDKKKVKRTLPHAAHLGLQN